MQPHFNPTLIYYGYISARQNLGKRKFLAKIKQDNESSIKLFERLGYKFVSKSDVFEEITLLYE